MITDVFICSPVCFDIYRYSANAGMYLDSSAYGWTDVLEQVQHINVWCLSCSLLGSQDEPRLANPDKLFAEAFDAITETHSSAPLLYKLKCDEIR